MRTFLTMLNRLKTSVLLLVALYSLYLLKTGMGIDVVEQYNAPRIAKLPLRVLARGVDKLRS